MALKKRFECSVAKEVFFKSFSGLVGVNDDAATDFITDKCYVGTVTDDHFNVKTSHLSFASSWVTVRGHFEDDKTLVVSYSFYLSYIMIVIGLIFLAMDLSVQGGGINPMAVMIILFSIVVMMFQKSAIDRDIVRVIRAAEGGD